MNDPASEADRWMEQQMQAAEDEMAAIAAAAEMVLTGPVEAYITAITALWRTDGRHVTADQYITKKRAAESAERAITGVIHDMMLEAGLPEELCEQVAETTRALIGTDWAKRLIATRHASTTTAIIEPIRRVEDTRPF